MKPNFKDGSSFSKHLFDVNIEKTEIKMNKPVYLGQAMLDLSKTLMYEFQYHYMRPRYGSKFELCYMDTDSFVYKIKAHDFYRDIARTLPIGENKNVIGLMG